METTLSDTQIKLPKKESSLKKLIKEIARRKGTMLSAIFIFILVFVAIFGPWITPYNPAAPDYNNVLSGPSLSHVFGTDAYGRDIFSRIIAGAQISLFVSVSAVLSGALVGTVLGLVSGFFGKIVDKLIMRICDVLFAFPDIILAIGIVAILGPGLKNVIIAVAFFSVPSFARLARGTTMEVKEQLFVESARSIGASRRRIVFKHIFPETLPSIMVYFTMSIGTTILAAASLSFLGLGADPSTPDWGAMLSTSRDYIGSAFHVVFFPGLIIFLTVLAFNVFGDGLRELMDPKLKD